MLVSAAVCSPELIVERFTGKPTRNMEGEKQECTALDSDSDSEMRNELTLADRIFSIRDSELFRFTDSMCV